MCNECIEIVLKLMIHNSTGVFIESSGSVLNKLHIKIPEAFQSFFMVDIDKNSRDTEHFTGWLNNFNVEWSSCNELLLLTEIWINRRSSP